MLHRRYPASDAPVLFALHFLGGSARAWDGVAARLAPGLQTVPLDLPGFGDSAATPGYSVAAMADHVTTAIRAAAPDRWLIAGHSMGAKVAAAVVRRAEDGEAGLGGLLGIVLLAGSPPSPEPMAESRRQDMLGWLSGTERERRARAERYADANASALDAAARERVVSDVLRAHPAAWRAWLEAGSREDWSGRVGRLRTPALILAGADDADLGPGAQRRLMAPHFAQARIEVLDGVRHLLPLEAPDRVAALIADHAGALPPRIPPAYGALIASDRTASRLRDGLLERATPDDPAYSPAALGPEGFAALRAVVDRVVPQGGAGRIDIAARLDRALAESTGDGWRYDTLPPDAEAFRAALRTLDRATGGFAALDPSAQDAALGRVAEGRLGAAGKGLLTADQMTLWFGDLRALAARLYVSHPATLARMGYSGVAAGGDGWPKQGFERLGIGGRDEWEPVA